MNAASSRMALVITPWPDLWSMQAGGAPSDYQAITGLLSSGFSICLIAPQPTQPSAYLPDTRLNHLTTYRIPNIFSWHSFLDKWKVTGFATRIIRYALFQAMALIAAWRIHRRVHSIDLIYGLSALVAPTTFVFKRVTGVPTVVRLFGTFLYPHLDSRWGLLKNFEEVIAFKLPVDKLVITDDGTLGDIVARRLGVPAARIVFWMNGVDRPAVSADKSELRRQLGIQPETVCVLAASRLVSWKRVDRLIRVAPRVVQSNPAFRFIILGEGPERIALEHMACELGVEKYFTFQGAVSHERVAEYMQAADIFISVYDLSNVGNPLLEALAIGKAIVTLDVGGTNYIISHEDNGLLLTPDNDELLAAALLELGSDPAQRQRLEEGARRYAERNLLTWKERMDREQVIIAELLGAWNQGKNDVKADL
jgi:glycosyltransferase involved in cell wall biosynthesis